LSVELYRLRSVIAHPQQLFIYWRFFANYNVGVKDLFKPDDLPSELVEGATLRGNEYGWSIISFPVALERGVRHGYACLGGQFQFRLGDGSTCEMYWLSADSTERLPGEQWADFSLRSCSEVKQNFQRIISEVDFAKEAMSWNLSPVAIENVVFVAYFVTESDLARLETFKW
jgi:hypothetical protein